MKTRIIFLILFSSWNICRCQAQEQQLMKPIITIKQRLLQRKPEEIKEALDSFATLHLMIAGNVYQTEKHVEYAYDPVTRKYNFKDELKYVEPLLNLGDISIVNLKTAFADDPDNNFSSPDEFALALKYSGINALMHANLYTANIDKATLTRTRDMLNNYDMYHTGAFADKYERAGNYPLIIHKRGFTVAVLNYTYMPSRPKISRDFYINEIDKSAIDRDMRMAFAYKPDFIIAYFNWGDDDQEIPTNAQQELAEYVFEKGANLIIGSCPNKPMRLDYLDHYKDGKQREAVVAYSLGNLIASDDQIKNRKGYIIDMVIKKNNLTSETKIDDWGVIPVYTYYDTSSVPGKTSVYSLPCWAIESGDIFPGIPYIEKRRVVNGAYEVRQLVGSSADEIQYNLNERIVDNVVETIHITNASLNNKFSQAREQEMKISPPPSATAALLTSTQESPSLAMVQEESHPQMNYPPAKQTSFLQENGKTVSVLSNTGMPDNTPGSYDSSTAVGINSTGNKMPASAAGSTTPDNSAGAAPVATSLSNPAQASKNNNSGNSGNTALVKNGSANNTSGGLSGNILAGASGKSAADDDEDGKIRTGAAVSGSTARDKTSNTSTGKQLPAPNTGDVDPQNEADAKATASAGATMNMGSGRRKNTDSGNYDDAGNHPVASDAYRTGGTYNAPPANNTPRNKNYESLPPDKVRAAVATLPALDASELVNTVSPEVHPDLTAEKGKELAVQTDTFYRIQIFALSKYVPMDTNYYTHLKGFEVVEDKGFFKYLLGRYKSYEECYHYWKSQMQPRYKQSFIVKYIDRKRILK